MANGGRVSNLPYPHLKITRIDICRLHLYHIYRYQICLYDICLLELIQKHIYVIKFKRYADKFSKQHVSLMRIFTFIMIYTIFKTHVIRYH